MDNRRALDPELSVVVEACAGSGKTWLLVSRMLRLLLAGAEPSQILAITFTRKAAQEMRARLQLWLRELANGDDDAVRSFLAERGLENADEVQLQRARELYRKVLLAQPGVTISTFHGWFMQVMQRAPLNAGTMQGMGLLERAASLQQEAWDELLESMQRESGSVAAQHMQWLFEEYGLFNARKLLSNFLNRRAEWWAYVQGRQDAVAFALDRLRAELEVDMEFDPVADWGGCGNSEELLYAFTRQLAANGTDTQQRKAGEIERAWTDSAAELRFTKLSPLLYTQAGEARSFKPTKKQDEAAFLVTCDALFASLQQVRDTLAEQQAYRMNEAVMHCGAAMLERYQALKQQKQQMDFSDLEWQLCHLLQQSEHAETMQYKLDSRYRHVLLDEFQDTNPLQWQILRAWFDAAVAVDSQPTVFMVGDPKQSIYRFRRADARLFGVARDYLERHFAAATEHNNATRRNAPPIVDAVNAVFREQPEGFEFAEHDTYQHGLPGHVEVLPLAEADDSANSIPDPQSSILNLRNPLTTPREEAGEGPRHREAEQFAEMLRTIAGEWSVQGRGGERRAGYGDVMVLVRNRTHLQVYEEALRARHIPFISSRRGGLLDTLEAEDLQALLRFLITPFADLALAQVLRTPLFACSDEDLMLLSGFRIEDLGFRIEDLGFRSEEPGFRTEELGLGSDEELAAGREAEAPPQSSILNPQSSSWWTRLQQLPEPPPALQRAHQLLQRWLALADKLPVHDLLDRIYFEGDMLARYRAVLPPEMRAKVEANLHAFMEIALSVDAGRYPSLPRFLQELRELRDSADDAPDEGRLGTAGDAVRIYTVHESKGLEAPIVWLLDANAGNNNRDGGDVLLDWPNDAAAPAHFSLYADLASRGSRRAPLFGREAMLAAREEMNLLYVAMTRAQQALIVSGNGKPGKSPSWYDRIAAVVEPRDNPLHRPAAAAQAVSRLQELPVLPAIVQAGERAVHNTAQQQRGIRLHALLQHYAADMDASELMRRSGVPQAEFEPLWREVLQLVGRPELQRYFDAAQYRRAYNEMPYVDGRGAVKRIDRLVEFDDEVWVLDYKMGERADPAPYRAQMAEYRAAMQAVYGGKPVRCALLFADGILCELD